MSCYSSLNVLIFLCIQYTLLCVCCPSKLKTSLPEEKKEEEKKLQILKPLLSTPSLPVNVN